MKSTLLSSLTANASAILKEASELAKKNNVTIEQALTACEIAMSITAIQETTETLENLPESLLNAQKPKTSKTKQTKV